MITAEVSHVNADTDVVLEYNSKNKLLTDTVTTADTPTLSMIYNREFTDSATLVEEIAIAVQYNLAFTESLSTSDTFSWTSIQNIAESIGTGDTPSVGDIFRENPTDGISVSDELTFFHDGMLNTNILNTRLISVGSQEVTGDDVTITLIEG